MKIEFKSSKEIWEGVGTLASGVVLGWATLAVTFIWRDLPPGYQWMWSIAIPLYILTTLASIGVRRISFNTSTKDTPKDSPRHT